MKTLVQNSTNLSKYIFEDGDTVLQYLNKTKCDHFIIADMNTSNSTVHTGVTPPEDWVGDKYFFDGSNWTANPDYVEEPTVSGIEPPE